MNEFDLKTGKTLSEYDPENQCRRPKYREVEHSYLEHWLAQKGLLEHQFWSACFYPGVTAEDQAQLEQEDKVFVFANGQRGYFTDAETAQLIRHGDARRGIAPLYAAGKDAAHDAVAYGSLAISDGMSSVLLSPPQRSGSVTQSIRLLVIDDLHPGFAPLTLLDRDGQPLSFQTLQALLDRMGDGSMLVSSQVMLALAQPKELERWVEWHLGDSESSPILVSQLVQEYRKHQKISTNLVSREIAQPLNQAIHNHLSQTVSQFRAATPDLPGMLKGTLTASRLVEHLGVDAIASVSCIKGDDGRLSAPGIRHLSQLWLNRKLNGRYNTQAVGTQIKGTIPQATANELNPLIIEKAQAFAEAVGDVQNLARYYLQAQSERSSDATSIEAEKDWLGQILEQDQYGVMQGGFPTVVDKLERFIRHERVDLALRGLRIPSAMAQHHSQLKPWEICNRDLPAGAIVAYYRSPVPNVGAVAIAINNPNSLRQADREAYEKRGVSHLNPWTAKTIAITDFDGDVNAYFVGYLPVEADLPNWVRQQLREIDAVSPEQQYEAARHLFAGLIEQLNQGDVNARIQFGEYPQTVAEFIERTSPERKPPAIQKQPKLKHPWHDSESQAQATWRAWSITAENPIGRVANAGMILQSLASECLFARTDLAKETLLQQISLQYRTLLKQEEQGKLVIPRNEALAMLGFPAYDLKRRVQALAGSADALVRITEPAQQCAFISEQLQLAHDLLSDVANGPNAANLQTAVDGAKSARGINETLHQLALALQYKPHLLRQHRRDPSIYIAHRPMPSNTDEPIGWMVEAANKLYEETVLYRANNVGMRFGSLMDGIKFSKIQKADAERIVVTYLRLMSERSQVQRHLSFNAAASRQPYLVLTSSQTGRTFTIERLIDGTTGHEAAVQDLWRSAGPTDWHIRVEPARQHNQPVFTVQRLVEGQSSHLLGWVSTADAQRYQLERFFQTRRQLEIHSPVIEVHPPLILENDVEAILERAIGVLKAAKATIPVGEQAAYAAAMWSLKLPTGERLRDGRGLNKRAKLGMGVALQLFPEVVGERLQQLPPLKLSGFRYREVTPELGEHQLVTRPYRYLDRAGYVQEVVALALVEDDQEPKHLGYLGERTLPLPLGLRLQGQICFDLSQQAEGQNASATVQVTALLGREPLGADHQVINSRPGSAGSFYAPTYQELQDWWRAARVQQDEGKMAEIGQLGQRLGEVYRNSFNMQLPTSPLPAPETDYRSLAVVLNVQQQQQMKADQACYDVIHQDLVGQAPYGVSGQSQRDDLGL